MATKVFLESAPIGPGIIAGDSNRDFLELAGFKNVISKIYGSRIIINVACSTNEANRDLKNIKLSI